MHIPVEKSTHTYICVYVCAYGAARVVMPMFRNDRMRSFAETCWLPVWTRFQSTHRKYQPQSSITKQVSLPMCMPRLASKAKLVHRFVSHTKRTMCRTDKSLQQIPSLPLTWHLLEGTWRIIFLLQGLVKCHDMREGTSR